MQHLPHPVKLAENRWFTRFHVDCDNLPSRIFSFAGDDARPMRAAQQTDRTDTVIVADSLPCGGIRKNTTADISSPQKRFDYY